MDDTPRRVGDEDIAGRGDERTRDYTGTTRTPAESEARVQAAQAEGLDEKSARRTQEIREEIEQTREDMSETIDAIGEKLRPGNIVSEAGSRVKSAAREGVRTMAERANETARSVMSRTQEAAGPWTETAREHAVPLALIGAGVTWMLVERFRDGGKRADWRDRGSRYASPERYDERDEYYRTGAEYRREYSGGGSLSGKADEMASRAKGATRDLTGRAKDMTGDMTERARRSGRRAQNQLQRLMHENPLMVGAAAIVVGAAVGLALPETERENELMGEARDTVVDRAQDVARKAVKEVRQSAADMAGEVTSRVVSGKEENK